MNILNESNKLIDCKYLEELFTSLLVKDDINRTLASMRKVLNASFDCDCVDIFIGDKSEKLYGMSVYPSQESMNKIIMSIINDDSKNITKKIAFDKIGYVVEIDQNMLWNPLYKFNPDELVAMLLHEIGHVTADTDFYNDLAFAYKDALYNMEKDKNKLAKTKFNSKDFNLGALYIMSSISSTSLMSRGNKDNAIMKEHIADKFVVNNGYGEALQSALDKISKVYLLNFKDSSRSYKDKIRLEAETYIMLCNNFELRKKYVKDLMDIEEKKNPSCFVTRTISRLKKLLFNKKTNLREGTLLDKTLLDESFMDKFKRNPIKISQCDIDEMRIEAEMMEDWDDKSILVYKIHKRLTQLAIAKSKNDLDSYQLNTISAYEKQLSELLKKVMDFKKVEKRYGVFIKYPKGYEG